ncbi:MAG TPA: N,N-dimethylformamidase beta subunit family domain-containing protein [Candidatus Dormibacteraeota bacterium]|nr:N,N-dimethylformamidase beta subunit family domain-containing protein [Candidatus Dormibacteraeota bacterium]
MKPTALKEQSLLPSAKLGYPNVKYLLIDVLARLAPIGLVFRSVPPLPAIQLSPPQGFPCAFLAIMRLQARPYRASGLLPGAVLLLLAACLALFSLAGCQGFVATPPSADQLISARAIVDKWQLDNPARNHEIEGYASHASINRGEPIRLFVNTAEPTYTIEIYRMGWYGGTGAKKMLGPLTRPGTVQPAAITKPATGLLECNWGDPFLLYVPNSRDPADWPSGVYLAKLTASKSGTQSYITFVVRDDFRRSDLLFQASVTTYQAYNRWGGPSLYTTPRSYQVSFDRPYRRGHGSGDFLFWEYSMVRFLEREGYDVTYATDIDTHERGDLLRMHKGFLSVGHDEYWTWQMRDHIEAARDRGVGLGFFGANIGYWQIRLESSAITGEPDRTIVGYKNNAALDPLANDPDPNKRKLTTTLFRNAPVNRPEDALIGVMHRSHTAQGDIVIEDAGHWVFEGTGLRSGDHLPGLLGYEVDEMFGHAPAGTKRIAHSPYQVKGEVRYADMTSYDWPSGSTVVAVGTIHWSWALDESFVLEGRKFANPAAQQATRNILRRFGAVLPRR